MDYLIAKEPEKSDYLIEPEPETPAQPQGLMSKAKDTAVSFGIGANSLLQMAGDFYGLGTGDMDNAVSRQARENIQYLQQSKSPELRQAEEARRKAIEADEDELGKALTYVRQTVTNPSLLSNALAEQVPNLVGTGGAGALAKAGAEKVLLKTAADQAAKRLAAKKAAQIGTGAAVAAGAGMQGTDVGADLYDEAVSSLDKITDEQAMSIPEIASLMEEKDATLDEAKTAFALALGREAFALGATVSAGAQMLPGGRTIERAFVGKQAGRRLAGAITGGLGEAASEAVEEGGSRVAANLLARQFEPDRPLAKGVGEAVGQAAVVGGIPGAAFGAASSRPSPQPAPEGQTTAGKTGEAPASAATNALAGAPEVALESSEGLTPEQFYAAVNIRQARLMGGQPDPEDIRIAGEVPLPKATIDPEEANRAIEEAQSALQEWVSSTPNAPQTAEVIFDPELLHNGYGVQGYYKNDGTIAINAAFVTPDRVASIANHEWAHQTLATEAGQKAFADFVQREIPQGELDALAARYKTQDRRVLLEEWIAQNQEKAPGVIERIVARIREWLASFDIVNLSDAEVADIMLRTLRQQAENRIQPDTFEGMQPAEGERFSLSAEPKRISGVMASPSITDINYDRAKRNLTSANQARFKSQISEYAPEAEIFDAVGDWADGSENSVAAIFQNRKSGDELQRLAAQVGLAGDQKAVLWWRTEPEGADAIHEMVWPKSVSMDEARQAMIDVGLENRTLIQTPEGVRGFVFDQGRQNLNKIEALNEHETQPSLESSPAAGDFLGSWTSRAEGRRAYRRVLGSTPQAEAGAGELRSGEVGGVRDRGEPEARFSLTDRVAQGRDTVLAAEAQKLKRGETTPAKYARKVEQRMPLRPFDEVPEPATDEDILRGLGNRMAGETLKRELKANPEDIEGQQVEARLDIPSYEDANVWTVTLHNPRERAGAAGKVLAYTPTAVLRDVTFTVNETAAMNVAAGARKSSFATMDGTYVPATAQSAYEQAVEAKESGDWVEIGMNPIRHSYFYDKADQRPVVSAEEVIQVGGLVLGRGVQYGEKSDQKFSLAQTQTPQFKRWFGDSKIVDADGNPQVMYHGASFIRRPPGTKVKGGDFTTFIPNHRGLIFVTPDPEFTETHFARGEGGRVYPLYVKSENPFDYSNPDHVRKLFGDNESITVSGFIYSGDRIARPVLRSNVEEGDWLDIEFMADSIREAGFDGMYISEEGVKNLAVFQPTQLKSATGNTGAFDPENPDIRYSLSEEPTKKPLGERALEDSKATKFKNQKGTAKYLGDLLKSEFPEGLDRMDPEAAEKLADLLDRELSLALTMPDNANAIGWYGREMEKVVEILRSPELNYELDNPVNRGVFNALLAITSNGQEVVDQFLKSAQLYEKWKKTGKIPSLGKWGGERNRAMAGQIKFLNQMLGLVGAEDTVGFLTSESSLREHLDNLYGMVAEARGLPEKATVAAKEAAIGKYLNAGMPTGELKDYNTVGAIVFGPKLGGGFFANLYGKFDRLTMDRWFMRTFHRLTGRLGFVDDRSIQGALDEARRDLGAVEYLVQTAAGVKKDAFDPVSKDRLSDSDLLAYIKSEGKKAFKNYREINAGLKENPEDASLLLQDTLRRTYNRIIKAESGLFDAPDNGSHRVFIRDVLNRVQQQRTQRGEKPIDTSDIQAILWYLEKDIWDKLKDKKEKAQDELDEQDEDDDDSAGRVSYSNGAVELYRRKTGKDYVFKSGNQPERAQVLASD
jgi:hypothetical protein